MTSIAAERIRCFKNCITFEIKRSFCTYRLRLKSVAGTKWQRITPNQILRTSTYILHFTEDSAKNCYNNTWTRMNPPLCILPCVPLRPLRYPRMTVRDPLRKDYYERHPVNRCVIDSVAKFIGANEFLKSELVIA
jgi:hypothetical protein